MLGVFVVCLLFGFVDNVWVVVWCFVIMYNEGFLFFEYNFNGWVVGFLFEKIDMIFGCSDEFFVIYKFSFWCCV